jgi:Kef-type K+ transport system membrane component KefB
MQTIAKTRSFLSRLGTDLGGIFLVAVIIAWGGITKGAGVALIYLAIAAAYLLIKAAFRYFSTGHFLRQLEEASARPN